MIVDDISWSTWVSEEERAALYYALFLWREKLRARYGTFNEETWTNHHIAVWW